MKFNVHERITMGQILPSLIPERSNRHFFALINKMALELSLTEKEIDYIGLKTGGQKFIDSVTKKEVIVPEGQLMWQDKQTNKNVDIPKAINDIIVKGFQEMDQRDDLPQSVIPLFDRFVDEAQWYKKE